MAKFAIDLESYPKLHDLYKKDQKEFVNLVRHVLENAFLFDEIRKKDAFFKWFEQYDEKSKKAFGIPAMQLTKEILEAFFDYKGIVAHHPNKEEAELLEVLEHENNPLSIFTNRTVVRDSEGREITKVEFLGKEMTFKDFLQGLLYASRYLNHAEYIKATAIGRYDLVEAQKQKQFMELMKIQPALEYQKLNGLVVGSRKEGTAFFDCGKAESNICPITKKEMLEDDEGYYSLDVMAYFSK